MAKRKALDDRIKELFRVSGGNIGLSILEITRDGKFREYWDGEEMVRLNGKPVYPRLYMSYNRAKEQQIALTRIASPNWQLKLWINPRYKPDKFVQKLLKEIHV